MDNRTLGIIVGLIMVIIMAYLVSGVAKPCEGNYEFNLKELMFKCSATPTPAPTPIPTVTWGDQVSTASETMVANRTEISGNWRAYEICVGIPDNGLMLKDSVKTEVIAGVASGSWGNWRKDLKFINNNDFGPTKVCRTFDHQIHDQDRVLKISVNYKLPE